jgi:hypothetical protein
MWRFNVVEGKIFREGIIRIALGCHELQLVETEQTTRATTRIFNIHIFLARALRTKSRHLRATIFSQRFFIVDF